MAGEKREADVDALRFSLVALRGATDEADIVEDDGDRPAWRRLCATSRANRTSWAWMPRLRTCVTVALPAALGFVGTFWAEPENNEGRGAGTAVTFEAGA